LNGRFKQTRELATTFADQAAIAIGNVRLFDEVQARTGELLRSASSPPASPTKMAQNEAASCELCILNVIFLSLK
jgi:hypothetical protein